MLFTDDDGDDDDEGGSDPGSDPGALLEETGAKLRTRRLLPERDCLPSREGRLAMFREPTRRLMPLTSAAPTPAPPPDFWKALEVLPAANATGFFHWV